MLKKADTLIYEKIWIYNSSKGTVGKAKLTGRKIYENEEEHIKDENLISINLREIMDSY